MTKFTLDAGRVILRDGDPFITIGRAGDTSPVEADDMSHFVTAILNTYAPHLDAAVLEARAANHWRPEVSE